MTTDKQLWILAGGNGAGKSTFYNQFLAPLCMPFVNADIIARDLDRQHPEAASYDAAKLAEILRCDLLQKGISFCFETVFSHPSKIDFVGEAKAWGYEVILVFIHLPMDQLNQARVAQRVSEGGHSVPTEKIVARIPRTLQHIRSAIPLADIVQFYDNASLDKPFQSVVRIENGKLSEITTPLPDWANRLLQDYVLIDTPPAS